MTTFVECRDAIVTLIDGAWETAYPSVPIFYENTLTVDLDTVGDTFLRVEIDFDDALQSTLGANPAHRTYGSLHLTLFAKEGAGVRSTLEKFDFLTAQTKFMAISGVVLQAPTPGRRDARSGWVSHELRVPFWFDSI